MTTETRTTVTAGVNSDGSITATVAGGDAVAAATMAADTATMNANLTTLTSQITTLEASMATLVADGASPTQAHVTTANTALTAASGGLGALTNGQNAVVADVPPATPTLKNRHFVMSFDSQHIQSLGGLSVAIKACFNSVSAAGILPATNPGLMP